MQELQTNIAKKDAKTLFVLQGLALVLFFPRANCILLAIRAYCEFRAEKQAVSYEI